MARQTVNDAMKPLRKALVVLAIVGIALGLGVAAGLGALLVTNAMLPAFRLEDDETLRELIPAAVAYATMAGTTCLVVFVAWRLRSRSMVTRRNGVER